MSRDHARLAIKLVLEDDRIRVRMRRDARDALEAQPHDELVVPLSIARRHVGGAGAVWSAASNVRADTGPGAARCGPALEAR